MAERVITFFNTIFAETIWALDRAKFLLFAPCVRVYVVCVLRLSQRLNHDKCTRVSLSENIDLQYRYIVNSNSTLGYFHAMKIICIFMWLYSVTIIPLNFVYSIK